MTRLGEIDFVKGLAVSTMTIFHVFYLSKQMNIYPFKTQKGLLKFLANFAQLVFITTLGLNLVISYQQNKDNIEDFHEKQNRRLFVMGIIATLASVLSYCAFPNKWVRFGVIHFALLSIFISKWIVHDEKLILTMVLGVLFLEWIKPLLIPFFHNNIHPLISFILGIYNPKYTSIDHFSIIPNIAIIGGGMLLGWTFYKKANRKFKVMDKLVEKFNELFGENNLITKFIRFLGKNSLWVYVIHYPIIYFILSTIKKIIFNVKIDLVV